MNTEPDTMTKAFTPWNKGKPQGRKKELTFDEVRTIKSLLAAENALRDLVLFSVAVDTMLRSCDLLALRVSDVVDKDGTVVDEFTVGQDKVKGRAVIVSLTGDTQRLLKRWIKHSAKIRWDYLFTSLRNPTKPIDSSTYRQLIKQWVRMARLDPERYSSHSLRRTKSAMIYEATGNVEACRLLLGHKDVAVTSAYLGVSEKDALELAKRIGV